MGSKALPSHFNLSGVTLEGGQTLNKPVIMAPRAHLITFYATGWLGCFPAADITNVG